MLGNISIRFQNQFLELSQDGKPLPASLAERLEALFTVTRLKYRRGQDAVNAEGNYSPVASERIKMFRYDDHGQMVCGKGYLPRLREVLPANGYSISMYDCNEPHPRPDRFEPRFDRVLERMQLRYRQGEALSAIVANEGGVIVAPPGYGKGSIVAMAALALPKARILVTTYAKEVAQTLVTRLTPLVSGVGLVTSGKRDWGRVTIVSAGSLHHVAHTATDEPDLILADELHELAAPTYLEQLWRFKRSRMFGFTASWNLRFDKADALLESIFGRVVFEMTYQEAVDQCLVVPIRFEMLPVHLDRNPAAGLKDTNKDRWGIWRNDARNNIISTKCHEFAADEQVLVLVSTVEHAVALKQYLPDFQLNYAVRDPAEHQTYVDRGLLDPADEPPMTRARRDQMRSAFEAGRLKKVISTLWDTGVDFTQLAVMVRAGGGASEIADIQAPGRTTRPDPATGKTHGLVIDCMDYFDPACLRQSHGRRKSYLRQGWEEVLPNGPVSTRRAVDSGADHELVRPA